MKYPIVLFKKQKKKLTEKFGEAIGIFLFIIIVFGEIFFTPILFSICLGGNFFLILFLYLLLYALFIGIYILIATLVEKIKNRKK